MKVLRFLSMEIEVMKRKMTPRFEKEELRPVQEYKTIRMSADGSSPEMLDGSGQVFLCYA